MDEHCKDRRFQELLSQVRAGSEEATRELFELCKGRVYKAVRRRLHRSLRPKFDSHDFVQAMWLSFYKQISVVPEFDREEDLLDYVIRIVGNKVADEYRRRRRTETHNVARERPLDLNTDSVKRSLFSRDPTPSQTMMAGERWSEIVKNLPDSYREVVESRLNGEEIPEIAGRLAMSETRVRRILKNLALTQAD